MKKILFLLVVTLALGLTVSQASAASLRFDLETEFSGATPPAGTGPWLSATFDDSFGGANTVRLTMSAHGLTGNEAVNQWYFNFDPAENPTLLSFIPVDTAAISGETIYTGIDAFKAGGDGLYDFMFDFSTSNSGGARFEAGETVSYDISYISPIDVTSFNFWSAPAGGKGPFPTAAHVISINSSNCLNPDDPDCDSGWVTVPEPTTMLLLGSGLIGLISFRKKFTK